ncbi:Hydrogen peroxide stress regulator 1 [Cytospora mali]|uniref:Hydrogen peroxide stress regulator 1 n=1 Tax=Cytospora mali TaxID=578113 RepID=A0A194W8Y1_CYTMA|nr:Hydrogen peroxide stress regulator 1 [Valsa mali]
MDFTFNYNSQYSGFPQDGPVYHGQSMPGDFETTEAIFGIDSSSQDVALWAHPSMQRFLKDPQRGVYFNLIPQPQLPGVGQPVTPIPPATSHGRQGSPFSSNEPSSCSGAQSPPADTDFYTDNMPSTPNDMALFTSYQPAIVETFEPQQQFFLTGAGDFSGDSLPCVSMGDVNPTEESQLEWDDSTHAVDFTSPQRSFTYGSQASSSMEMDATAPQAVDHGYNRMASPEEMPTTVKDEIQIPDHTSVTEYAENVYPTPSVVESDEDSEAEINAVSAQSDDDDDDYRPGKKRQPAQSARRATRSKRDAPKKPLEGSVSKRARTTPSMPQPAKILPPPTSGSKGLLTCPDCTHTFKEESTLQIHIKKQHTRPFICVFKFAGCTSTFASKNEWKRHVMSQHLLLHYWLCDIDVCAETKNDSTAALPTNCKRSRGTPGRRVKNTMADAEPVGPPLPDGAIFNRKDLYTQHLRRMHTPSSTKSGPSAKSSKRTHAPSPHTASSSCTSPSEWDDHIKALQSQAKRERCQLPVFMECPAPRCNVTFSGADAWDQRMEHVAKHLEKVAAGEEDPVVFGGPSDPTLMAWATRPEVAVVRPVGGEKWVLNNPLRSAGEGRGAGRKKGASPTSTSPVAGYARGPLSPAMTSVKSEIVVESGDEDAEGEEE